LARTSTTPSERVGPGSTALTVTPVPVTFSASPREIAAPVDERSARCGHAVRDVETYSCARAGDDGAFAGEIDRHA